MMCFGTARIARRSLVLGVGAWIATPGCSVAQARVATPRQTEGPFYPLDWSGDADNDLVVVQGVATRAQGQELLIAGRILGLDGAPLAGAVVDIWQCDINGVYRHPRDESPSRPRDPGFQGRGRAIADANGRYRFRTIRPVAYTSRAPHIHFKVRPSGRPELTTQMYFAGERMNTRDDVLNSIANPRARESVIVTLQPADQRERSALSGVFDIVLG